MFVCVCAFTSTSTYRYKSSIYIYTYIGLHVYHAHLHLFVLCVHLNIYICMCLDSIYMYISIYTTTYICSCICTYISMYAFFKYVHMVPIVTLWNWQTVWARLLTGYLGKLVGQGKLQFLWCRRHYFRCRVRMLLGSYRVAMPSFRIGFCWVEDWYHVKGNGRYGKHHASNLCWTWKHINVDLVLYCSLGRLDRGQFSESCSMPHYILSKALGARENNCGSVYLTIARFDPSMHWKRVGQRISKDGQKDASG